MKSNHKSVSLACILCVVVLCIDTIGCAGGNHEFGTHASVAHGEAPHAIDMPSAHNIPMIAEHVESHDHMPEVHHPVSPHASHESNESSSSHPDGNHGVSTHHPEPNGIEDDDTADADAQMHATAEHGHGQHRLHDAANTHGHDAGPDHPHDGRHALLNQHKGIGHEHMPGEDHGIGHGVDNAEPWDAAKHELEEARRLIVQLMHHLSVAREHLHRAPAADSPNRHASNRAALHTEGSP